VLTKTVPMTLLKAESSDGATDGQFEAIVSVFGNVDHGGDRVVAGAFADTLAAWEAKGDPIPVLWSHRSEDPEYHIGYTLEAKELLPGDGQLPEALKGNGGLYVKAQLDLDATKAAQVWRLLKGRRVTQFSFAYDIAQAAPIVEDGQNILELQRLDLFEVGPTLLGMNADTDLIGVKRHLDEIARQAKAGRVLSAKHEGLLRTAQDSIGEVLAALQDDGKANPATAQGATEEPPGAKAAGATAGPASGPSMDVLELELAALLS
jgi:HK97 family phage prohead protease